MTAPPYGVSTTLGLGSPGDGDLVRGLSDEALRELHHSELRLLRSRLTGAAAISAISGTAWIAATVAHLDPAPAFLAAYATVLSLFVAGTAARRLWILRQADPITIARAEAAASTLALANARAQAARFAARPPYLTYTIAGVIGAIGLLEFVVIGSTSRAIAVAGLVKAKVAAGEWWRLLTASFLHLNAFHLHANLMALLVFGRLAEAYSTRSRVLIAYLAAVVGCSLTSVWLLPHTTSVGASGGILGIVAFCYILSRRRPGEVPGVIGTSAWLTMLMTALLGLVAFRSIDNAGHAGGALAGLLVGWLTVPRESVATEGSPSRYVDDRGMAIVGAAAATVLAFGAVLTVAKVFAERPKAVTLVRAEFEPRYSGGYSIAIENLRDVPLEAYSIDVYDSDYPVARQWRDERGFETHNEGTGPIAPHERRVVSLGGPVMRLVRPTLRIAAVLFTDGTYQGSADGYEGIVEHRADVANDADYLIGVIDDARTEPPGRVVEFVDGKIDERMRAAKAGRRTMYTGDVAVIVRADADQPARFATDIEPERSRLVKLRDELRNSIR